MAETLQQYIKLPERGEIPHHIDSLFKDLESSARRQEWEEVIEVFGKLRELLNANNQQIEFLRAKIDSAIEYVKEIKRVAW